MIGRCAVDFVAVRGDDGAWHPYALEINLRCSSTTHPFFALTALTDGLYDPATGEFRFRHRLPASTTSPPTTSSGRSTRG